MAGGIKKTDDLLWRHWNIAFAVRHAIEFTNSKYPIFVEVGVGDGLSAFYALREIKQHNEVSEYVMHLYDTWGNLKKEDFERNETAYIYSNLDRERTKNNLLEFSSNLVYHEGYVPDTFGIGSPKLISYLHIDVSTAYDYISTLEFFYPRLLSGGVIIFDDYGSKSHREAKNMIDDFLHDKLGVLQKLPTRQAIYYKK